MAVAACLLGGAAQAQLEPDAPPTSPVPPYVPRGVGLGLIVNDGITWQARLTWLVNLVQQSNSDFIAVFEGGGGYALTQSTGLNGTNAATTFFYQHTMQAGLGYRGHYRNGFNWGFQATVGADFFGARFGTAYQTENDIVPGVEGWAQAGLKIGAVVYGLRLGVIQTLDQPVHSNVVNNVGGFVFTFFAEWR
jgi:hypothetical protein